jgi:hypothetical protein
VKRFASIRWQSASTRLNVKSKTTPTTFGRRGFPVSQLGDVKLVIAKKETDEDEENPIKYLATNKVDAPTEP